MLPIQPSILHSWSAAAAVILCFFTQPNTRVSQPSLKITTTVLLQPKATQQLTQLRITHATHSTKMHFTQPDSDVLGSFCVNVCVNILTKEKALLG